jgi:hypothetical protein
MGFLDLFTDDKKKKKDDTDDLALLTVLLDTEKEMVEKDIAQANDFDYEVEDEDDYYFEDEN